MSITTVADVRMCGIIMPISAIDGCDEAHWADVLSIVQDAVEEAGFVANLVSNADDVGIIQKRIIQNLYDNPIVVCDVSGKNANVMFELGMRLAFDKPTIIIKDDRTTYSFDTSPIEHLSYPRDLRFSLIVSFKERLVEKIKATFLEAKNNPNYTTFLKHFGEFKRVKLNEGEISEQQFVLEELRSMRRELSKVARQNAGDEIVRRPGRPRRREFCLRNVSQERAESLLRDVTEIVGEGACYLRALGENHFHINLNPTGVSPTAMADAATFLAPYVSNQHASLPTFLEG